MKVLWTVLSIAAAPFILLFMLVAPFLGVHFCPQEAIPLLGGAALLPFLGPLVRQARSKHHCCEPEHQHHFCFEDDCVDDPTPDPYQDWIQANMPTLKQFPNSWVAFNLKDGIVLAEESTEEFEKTLQAMGECAADLYTIHTSLYF